MYSVTTIKIVEFEWSLNGVLIMSFLLIKEVKFYLFASCVFFKRVSSFTPKPRYSTHVASLWRRIQGKSIPVQPIMSRLVIYAWGNPAERCCSRRFSLVFSSSWLLSNDRLIVIQSRLWNCWGGSKKNRDRNYTLKITTKENNCFNMLMTNYSCFYLWPNLLTQVVENCWGESERMNKNFNIRK